MLADSPARAQQASMHACRQGGRNGSSQPAARAAAAHLHLRPAAAVDDAAVAHCLAQHAQRVVQRALGLVEHVVACRQGKGGQAGRAEGAGAGPGSWRIA